MNTFCRVDCMVVCCMVGCLLSNNASESRKFQRCVCVLCVLCKLCVCERERERERETDRDREKNLEEGNFGERLHMRLEKEMAIHSSILA